MSPFGRFHVFGAMPESGRTRPERHLGAASTSPPDLRLFRNFQCVIDLDPEVSHGTFELGMAKQELDGPQVFGSLVDQCRLSPPQAVGTVDRRIESDRGNPPMHDASVLTRGDVRRFRQATGEKKLLRLQIRLLDS